MTIGQLRESIIELLGRFEDECEFFPDGVIPPDHIAHHIERLVNWCNATAVNGTGGEEHNGWTNYETWLVALWLDNDEKTYRYWRNEAADVVLLLSDGSNPAEKRRAAAGPLAWRLKEGVTPGNEPLTGLSHDLLAGAYATVNWVEVATHILDEMSL